jgi:DNA-binding NarL/FixJ family response regulator
MAEDLIRIVLADDHAVVRAGLKAILGTARDMRVVGEASSGQEAVALAERLRPDVIVMDLTMDGMDGLPAVREIAQKALPSRVLMLTMHGEDDYLLSALEAGAAGYLVKSAADRELIEAVRTVARGQVFVRTSAAGLLAKGLARKDPAKAERARFDKLTGREQDVFKLVAAGYSAPEIGSRMRISPKTVDTYKQRIHEKMGLAHRSDYVQLAVRLGLLAS